METVVTQALPPHPHLDHLRRQARDLHRALLAGDAAALQRAAPFRPGASPKLSFAQLVIARELGFASWPALAAEVRRQTAEAQPEAEFIDEVLGLALGRGWNAPQAQQAAARLTQRRPRSTALALVRGDLAQVKAALQAAELNAPLPPWGSAPLAYAAFSSLVALPAHRAGLMATIDWLLAEGADPNAVLRDPRDPGQALPALYGAVARARCLDTVQRLLAAGAQPNDNESMYHATEQRDRGILAALVAAGGRWTGTNALFRQLDHDDLPGLVQCLGLGADPNERGPDGRPALHHALQRGRGLPFVQALVEHGADPSFVDPAGHTPAHWAAAAGERATLAWLTERGWGLPAQALAGPASFLVACAAADEATARAYLAQHPDAIQRLRPHELRLLPDQAQRGRHDAVKLMLSLGWPVAAKGDWDASALNQAAFRGDAAMVRLLLQHGARWDERNGFGGDAMGSCRHAQFNQPDPAGDYEAVAALLIEAGAPA